MISKNKSKFIISLQKKKVRDEEQLYVIEGDKLVREFLSARINLKTLIAKPEFIQQLSPEMKRFAGEIENVTYEELKTLSTLKTPHNAIAIVPISTNGFNPDVLKGQLSVALDFVQDPGNLGTIIRAAAWFGIRNIICSNDCVDVYNPKVIQATMGAILHVNIYYKDLKEVLKQAKDLGMAVFGTMLDGEGIYNNKLSTSGIIILGNESKGISEELIPFITDRITIPGPGKSIPGIESLNVGMAASVVFSEFYRRFH